MPASVLLTLHHPPVVETIGVGVHGITGLHDSFLLPDHWQFHLYAYSATLTLGSGPGFTGAGKFAIRPGHVSFVPPGVPVSFHYRGRSEHIYVHLRLPEGGPAELVPVMQDAGDRAPALSAMRTKRSPPHRTGPSRRSPRCGRCSGGWRGCPMPAPGAATQT